MFQSASALASGRCRSASRPWFLQEFQSASALASGRSQSSRPTKTLNSFNPRPLSRADDGVAKAVRPEDQKFQSASALASGR